MPKCLNQALWKAIFTDDSDLDSDCAEIDPDLWRGQQRKSISYSDTTWMQYPTKSSHHLYVYYIVFTVFFNTYCILYSVHYNMQRRNMPRGASWHHVRHSSYIFLSTRFSKKGQNTIHKWVFCGRRMIPIITRGSRGEKFSSSCGEDCSFHSYSLGSAKLVGWWTFQLVPFSPSTLFTNQD